MIIIQTTHTWKITGESYVVSLLLSKPYYDTSTETKILQGKFDHIQISAINDSKTKTNISNLS